MNPIFMVLINVLIMVNSESPESTYPPPSLFENLGAFFGQEMFAAKCTFVVVGKTIWYVLKKTNLFASYNEWLLTDKYAGFLNPSLP